MKLLQADQADALKLAKTLQSLATLKQPTIARVHGIAFGGGMGLASLHVIFALPAPMPSLPPLKYA